jgi:hypothetical protein
VVINKEMALQMTLRDTLRFDLEKSSIYKRANVRPVFGAEDEDILHEVPDDTPIDFYDFSVMNALPFRSNGAYDMALALPSRRHMTELAAEKPQNYHANFVRILNRLRNLISPWHFRKSGSLASLGMTTNYGVPQTGKSCSSRVAGVTTQIINRGASGAPRRRPLEIWQ